LSLGEILDRALTMLVSSWRIFVPVGAIVVTPGIFFAPLQVGSSQYRTWESAGLAFERGLAFLAIAFCAVAVAQLRYGPRTSVSHILAGLSKRWATIVVMTLVLGLAAFAGDLPAKALNTGSTIPSSNLVSLILAGASLGVLSALVLFVSMMCITSAALESATVADCFATVFRLLVRSDTALRTLALFGALLLWGWVFGALLVVGIELAKTTSIVRYIGEGVVLAPLWSFATLTMVVYYLDVRLRQGTDVPARLAAELEDDSGEEASSAT
jgi:hypothetical protein